MILDERDDKRRVSEWVGRYIAAGWHPLPLKFAEKELRDKDGLKRTYALADFNETDNVGLQLGPSRSGVAVDFDASEITPEVVWRFLPATFGWGRASKPLSQVLYRSQIEKSVVFKDLGAAKEKATLIEIRATHQSMVPPSVHPNGEDVVPVGDLQSVELDPKVLRRAAQLLATYALFVRYYPPRGARHHWALHLAGFCRYLDLKQDEVTQLFQLAMRAADDGDQKDRLDAVRTTFAHPEDDPIGGAKLLAENMDPERGPKFISSLRAVWGDTGRSAKEIDRLNQRHAVVFMTGGSVVVMTEDAAGLRFTRPADFKLLYPESIVIGTKQNGEPASRPLGEIWLTHPQRRYYEGIELAPNGTGRKGFYNRWKGFTVEPKRGDWSLYRQQLQALVNHDEDCERYVLSWLALTVRHPDQQIGTCVAFRGQQGTGKTTFCKWFGELFGSHFLHLDSERRLLGNFNAHLETAIVVLADEAVWAGGKQGLGALKRIITEDTLDIERKYFDTVQIKNMVHLLVNSNEDWVVPKGLGDRRFLVVNASDELKGNVKFFQAVWQQLHDGGLAGLLYDLLNDDALVTDIRTIPVTLEGQRQTRLTLDPLHSWWVDELEDGDLWARAGLVEEFREMHFGDSGARSLNCEHYAVARERIMARAETSLGKSSRFNINRTQMGVFLGRVLPFGYPATIRLKRERHWVLPSLEVCRARWRELYAESPLSVE